MHNISRDKNSEPPEVVIVAPMKDTRTFLLNVLLFSRRGRRFLGARVERGIVLRGCVFALLFAASTDLIQPLTTRSIDPFAYPPTLFQPWPRLHPRAPRRLPRHPRRPLAAPGRSASRATRRTSTRSSSRSTPTPASPRRACPS